MVNVGSNLASMAKKNAETIGAALGLFKDGIDPVTDSLTRLPEVHMPDWGLVFSDVMGDMKTPATAWLVAQFLKGFNLPFVGKVGKPLEKAAFAWAFGRVGLALLYRSTHKDEGSFDRQPRYRSGGNQGMQSYNYAY